MEGKGVLGALDGECEAGGWEAEDLLLVCSLFLPMSSQSCFVTSDVVVCFSSSFLIQLPIFPGLAPLAGKCPLPWGVGPALQSLSSELRHWAPVKQWNPQSSEFHGVPLPCIPLALGVVTASHSFHYLPDTLIVSFGFSVSYMLNSL